MNQVDHDAAAAAGIRVTNVPFCVDEVSDHALTLLLMAERRVLTIANRTAAGDWDFGGSEEYKAIHRLRGRTVGIIGTGRIGREVARKARVFGYRTLGYDPYVTDPGDPQIEMLPLDSVMRQSDAVVTCADLNPSSKGVVGRDSLAHVRPGTILVNIARGGLVDEASAGINPARIGPADVTLDYWRKVFAVNLEGPLRASQHVFPIMRDQGGGSIVNIGTMAAYSGGGTICAYGASKGALLNLTKSMAMDWAKHNVRVNMLSPGPFMSEMMEGGAKTQPGFLELVAGGTFMKRIADPDEIVGPVCYLVSDASSFVTGDDLSVSGGMMK
jgi:NAD(P)-dependent dehydrogenase (short-subunit alcohol dehydrogenase family)